VSPNPLGRRRRHAAATDVAVRWHLGRGSALPPSGGTARAGWNLDIRPARAARQRRLQPAPQRLPGYPPGGQAGLSCLVSWLVIDTLRGLAASWTGMARVSTPAV